MARAKRKKSGATFGSRTDVGCVREHNEDSLAVAPPLYVVCDGMGGHAAGEVASEIAVDVICDRAPGTPRCLGFGPGGGRGEPRYHPRGPRRRRACWHGLHLHRRHA